MVELLSAHLKLTQATPQTPAPDSAMERAKAEEDFEKHFPIRCEKKAQTLCYDFFLGHPLRQAVAVDKMLNEQFSKRWVTHSLQLLLHDDVTLALKYPTRQWYELITCTPFTYENIYKMLHMSLPFQGKEQGARK